MTTNAEILAAVVTRWAMPLASALVGGNVQNMKGLNMLQTKIRSTGMVGPNWSIVNDIAPFLEPVVNAVARPMLNKALQNVPDEAIPQLAHGIVDSAIAKGELTIMDGAIRCNADDLAVLKRLLNANLPFVSQSTYKVKENEE